MESFNEYGNQLDFSQLEKLFLLKGIVKEYKKKEYFIREHDISNAIGYIVSGAFRFIRIDSEGNEHIVGYSFKKDYVCDYPSFIKHSGSLCNVQAIVDSKVYLLSRKDVFDFWETNMNTQRFGRMIAEEMFIEMYQRLLNFYCDTPEQRYQTLTDRCPSLLKYIRLKEIASFIGVTPETVSHIRKKLAQK